MCLRREPKKDYGVGAIQYGKALSARKTPPIKMFEKAAGPMGEPFTNPPVISLVLGLHCRMVVGVIH